MAQCATTALAGALPRPWVRGARGRFGGLGPVPGVVSLPFPPSRPACPALLGCVGVGAQHCPLALHALWGLCAAGSVGVIPGGGGLPPL